ncbi:MAG TPA: VOC family protein [Candidatus Saccharimonadales bacterium]|nr:VOC family protein [Candidatus Saccharimonadales bacterium]
MGRSAQRISNLIPFVRVIDVEASVAFYEHLGFEVQEVARYRDRLSWAALRSGDAEIMFEGTHGPPDPDHQRVLFYLYADELAALRARLLAAGVKAGEIEDGSPGPREEMRVTDPDGYVLMIAQIDQPPPEETRWRRSRPLPISPVRRRRSSPT